VIVNATELRDDFADKTCILNIGDHPIISKPSVVFYQGARILGVQNFPGLLRSSFKQVLDSSPDLMRRIRQGAVDSEFMDENIRHMILRCRWRPPSPDSP